MGLLERYYGVDSAHCPRLRRLGEFPFYNTGRAGNWYDFGFLLGMGSPLLGGLGARGRRSRRT